MAEEVIVEGEEKPVSLGEEMRRVAEQLKKEEEVSEDGENVRKEGIDAETESEESANEGESESDEEREEVEESTEEEFPLVPKDLSPKEREAFEEALMSDDPVVKKAAEVFIERYNSLKKGFIKKTEQYSNETKELKEIQQVLAPFDEQMQVNGISKAQYLNNMIAWENALRTQPALAVKQIMQTFNVTPQSLGFVNEDEGYLDNEDEMVNNGSTNAFEQRLIRLEQDAANRPMKEQIDRFQTATDRDWETNPKD